MSIPQNSIEARHQLLDLLQTDLIGPDPNHPDHSPLLYLLQTDLIGLDPNHPDHILSSKNT